MNVLIFGGMSPRHYEWVREVAKALESRFDEVRFLDYEHWDKPDTEMDLEHEIARAAELAKGFGTYVVIAKSIGTVVATLANARGLLQPQYCVFMGLPLQAIAEIPEVDATLPKLPATHFVHNEHDPVGSADGVKAYIEAHEPEQYDFLVAPGNTHDYIDFKLITDLALG